MTVDRFVVTRTAGAWIVNSSDGLRISYQTQAEALGVAIAAAQIRERSGASSQVLALGPDNQLRTLWTSTSAAQS